MKKNMKLLFSKTNDATCSSIIMMQLSVQQINLLSCFNHCSVIASFKVDNRKLVQTFNWHRITEQKLILFLNSYQYIRSVVSSPSKHIPIDSNIYPIASSVYCYFFTATPCAILRNSTTTNKIKR